MKPSVNYAPTSASDRVDRRDPYYLFSYAILCLVMRTRSLIFVVMRKRYLFSYAKVRSRGQGIFQHHGDHHESEGDDGTLGIDDDALRSAGRPSDEQYSIRQCIARVHIAAEPRARPTVGGDVGTLIDEGPSANSFHRDQRATFVSAFRLQSGTLDGSRVDPTSSSFCGVTEVIGVTIGAQRNGESVVGSRDLWRTEVHSWYESLRKKNNRI